MYSTGPGGAKAGARDGRARRDEPRESLPPQQQSPRVRRERAGRRGKTVTVVTGVVLVRTEASGLLSELKRSCGGGGALKPSRAADGSACFTLELQGDHADGVVAALVERGFRAKRAGG